MPSAQTEQRCSMVVFFDKSPSQGDLKKSLESDNASAKAAAMKQVIAMVLNGEQMDQLFFTIVRYVLPTDDHLVQKLLLLYLVSARRRGRPTFSDICSVFDVSGARRAGLVASRIPPPAANRVFGWASLCDASRGVLGDPWTR